MAEHKRRSAGLSNQAQIERPQPETRLECFGRNAADRCAPDEPYRPIDRPNEAANAPSDDGLAAHDGAPGALERTTGNRAALMVG